MRDRRFGRDLAGESKVDGDVAVDGDHDLARVDLGACRRAREQHRLAHRFAQRRHPEVVLELGERLGKRLRDRSGTVDRPARHAADLGGDRPRLQQPHVAVVRRSPTRRPAARRRRARPSRDERDQPPEMRRARAAGRRSRRTRAPWPWSVEHVPRAATSPLTSCSGPPCTASHDPAVAPARNRVDAEHDAAELRARATAGRAPRSAGPPRRHGRASRAPSHRDRERVEAADADDRVELAGHRRVRGVLDHRRAARHERCVAVGPLERLAHRGVVRVSRAGVDRVRERVVSTTPGSVARPRSRHARGPPPCRR